MDTTTSADGTVIAYERTGEGAPVVLVGGAFNDRDSPRPLGAHLPASVVYDRRGRGASGDTAPYAVQREVEDLAAVVGATGAKGVYGMSSGGTLVLLAAAAGLPVDRVVVFEPPFRAAGDGSPTFADEQFERIAAGDREGAVLAFFGVMGMPPAAVERMRQGPAWSYLLGLAHTLPYDAAIVGTGAVPDLRGVTAAVLVVDGAASPESLRGGARAVVAALPRATAVSLPDQTHDVDVAVLGPVVAGFFA